MALYPELRIHLVLSDEQIDPVQAVMMLPCALRI
jgi:hypothetical protein